MPLLFSASSLPRWLWNKYRRGHAETQLQPGARNPMQEFKMRDHLILFFDLANSVRVMQNCKISVDQHNVISIAFM